jgi:hypothetical protein
LKAGRKRVHEYLRFKEFKFAAKMSCKEQLTLKKKVQMMAMVGGIEPLFYYLFYLKPLKKKG